MAMAYPAKSSGVLIHFLHDKIKNDRILKFNIVRAREIALICCEDKQDFVAPFVSLKNGWLYYIIVG